MEEVPENQKDSNIQLNPRALRLLMVLITTIVALGGVVLYWKEHRTETPSCPGSRGSRETGISSTFGVYYNQRLGFSFVIPPGYRLATDLMQYLNASSAFSIANWSPENTQEVVITASTNSQEQAFVQAAMNGEKNISFTNVTDLPRSIYVVGLNLDWKTVQNDLSLAYQHVVVSGFQAIRYADLANEEVVVVPYEGSAELAIEDSVGTIFMKMSNAADSFDRDAFGAIIASFCFVKS